MNSGGITLDDLRVVANAQRNVTRTKLERSELWVDMVTFLGVTQLGDNLRLRVAVQSLA